MLKKSLIFAAAVTAGALLWYWSGGTETLPEKAPQSAVGTKSTAEKSRPMSEKSGSDRTLVKTAAEQTAGENGKVVSGTAASRMPEKESEAQETRVPDVDLAEMREEMEEIPPEERSEDYYEGNETVRRDELIGGADVVWEAPRKPPEDAGKFGLPPSIH